jgi:hypothetical protein
MIRHPDACPGAVRQEHPRAAIIRALPTGGYVAFARADDARGHPSGRPVESGVILASGRHVLAADLGRAA